VGYGLRSDDSRERSAEALEILTRAWTEEPFSYQGKFFQVSLPALRPRVYQRPHPPIWRSVVTPGSFTECGRLGVPILTSRLPLGVLGERLKLYEDGLTAGGHPASLRDRLRRDVAVWRHVYVAESHAEAEDHLADTLAHTRRHMLGARAAHNPEDYRVDPAVVNAFNDPSVAEDEAVRQSLAGGAVYGTAREVAERVAELREAGVRHILCQMSFGYLGHARIVDSMKRFGEQVMPAFRD
jgi:alkanesulfonate monooxygenase SsuD/methylene tetrahydromethanopterin reductase-like flavin-dependent oxidoreductase (luciferase family)